MGLLDELEVIKYRQILDLVKNNEVYDRKKSSITALEAFQLLHNRFKKLSDIILPLKEKIGKDIEITDIDFNNGMQEDYTIVIKFIKNGKQHFLSISNIEYEQVEVISTDKEIENDVFVQNNKKIFLNIFRGIDEYNLDNKVIINSASRKYVINDLGDYFTLRDSDNKIFNITARNSLFDKNHSIISKIDCNYSKLKDILESDGNALCLYNHIHFYEDDMDKKLIKKLTHC